MKRQIRTLKMLWPLFSASLLIGASLVSVAATHADQNSSGISPANAATSLGRQSRLDTNQLGLEEQTPKADRSNGATANGGSKRKPTKTPTTTPVPISTPAPTKTAIPTIAPTIEATATQPATQTALPTIAPSPTATAVPSPASTSTAIPTPPDPTPTSDLPRVNVRPSSDSISWHSAPIFWFGRATENDNYVDVRVAYDRSNLYLYATVVDYYLWWAENGSSDPRQRDSLAVYLATAARGQSPTTTDYTFVSAFRWWPAGNDPRWHLQARGTGGGWNYGWSPATPWTDNTGARWYNSGPNDNSDRDSGWTSTISIPWATLGLSGPPTAGTEWGLGLQLFDRDSTPTDPMRPSTVWPTELVDSSPASWGTIAFDPPTFTPPASEATGTTTLRGGLTAVKDAYVGGGGTCAGGVFGDGDAPHPTGDLFVQSQGDVADFPCFSKSYLWFDTSPVPPGKKIISASLTLHEFGGSDPGQAWPSLIQLFRIGDEWDPATLTWNNAPIARENLSSTMVPVLPTFPGWPGVANSWDATQVVTEAHASGTPVNIALYSADTAYHSGKYFVSSDTGEWNALGRPTVKVVWGD